MQRFAIDLQLHAETYHYEIELVHDLVRQQAAIRREQLTADGKALYKLSDGEVRLYGDDPSATPRTTFPFGRKRSFLPDMEPPP